MVLDDGTLAALADASLRVLGEAHPLTGVILMAAAGDLDSHDVWCEIERLPDQPRRLFASAVAEVFPAFAGPGDGYCLH